jgi:hypothetical protein
MEVQDERATEVYVHEINNSGILFLLLFNSSNKLVSLIGLNETRTCFDHAPRHRKREILTAGCGFLIIFMSSAP